MMIMLMDHSLREALPHQNLFKYNCRQLCLAFGPEWPSSEQKKVMDEMTYYKLLKRNDNEVNTVVT